MIFHKFQFEQFNFHPKFPPFCSIKSRKYFIAFSPGLLNHPSKERKISSLENWKTQLSRPELPLVAFSHTFSFPCSHFTRFCSLFHYLSLCHETEHLLCKKPFQRRLLDFSDDNEPKKEEENSSENPPNKKTLPGKAVQITEEKPFMSNDELPEAELYYGGELGDDKEPESETERDMRLMKICQAEEMKRLWVSPECLNSFLLRCVCCCLNVMHGVTNLNWNFNLIDFLAELSSLTNY